MQIAPRSRGGGTLESGRIGVDRDAELDVLCGSTAWSARPLASGALFSSGQEVLLEVPSGIDGAAGERTLALMRRTDAGYRLVTHLGRGGRFEAHARIAVPGLRDVLVLCVISGRMGVQPGRCGILGQGSFSMSGAQSSRGSGDQDELGVVQFTGCGPGGAVGLGQINARDRRLWIDLVMEEFLLEPGGPDESPVGPYCSRKTVGTRKSFTVKYELDPMGIRRATPVPGDVLTVLGRY